MRVLIIEDDSEFRHKAIEALKRLQLVNLEIISPESLKLVQLAFKDGIIYDWILLDINLRDWASKVTGLDIARKYIIKETKIILYSSEPYLASDDMIQEGFNLINPEIAFAKNDIEFISKALAKSINENSISPEFE
jgi:CheY-like chemotaxis protein